MAKPPSDQPTELSEVTLEEISGGPNRRIFDHIAAYNFKVEIEGVTQGAFKAVDEQPAKTKD